MSFDLNEEQIAIKDMCEAFARDEMAPHAAQWDHDSHFPVDVLKKAAELGLAGIYTDPEYGGSGLGRLEAAIIFEELSAACPSTAAFLSIHNMVSWMISDFGTTEQKEKYLPDLMTMDKLGSYCLTEPNAGSDAASLRTKAVKDGDDYILNGAKAFISGGGVSDLYLIMARTGEDGPKGISAFLVDKDMPGVSFGKNEDKMGWKSQPTAVVNMDDVRVPAANLLGGVEGQGFKFAMKGLDGGRINIAACSVGGAKACLNIATEYVKDRKQFGKPIAAFQNTQFKLADMATDLDASRLMVHRAARSLDAKSPDAGQHCAMAKRFATDHCFQIVDDALQLHGGYGYLKEYPIERYLRDLRVHRILEGTNEVMRIVISRGILAD